MSFGAKLSRWVRATTAKVMSLTLLGLLLGLAVDVLIAARLGSSRAADVLFVAIGLPRFLDTVVRTSLRSSLVPFTLERQHALEPERFARHASGLLNTTLALGVVLAALVVVSASPLAAGLGPGLDADGKRAAAGLFYLAIPFIVLAPVATYLEALANSQRRFAPAALRTAFLAGSVLALAGTAWGTDGFGERVLIGYDVGMLLTVVVLAASLRGTGLGYRPWTVPPRSDLRGLASAIGPPSLGFAARQGSRLVERALASLAGPGGVTAYALSFRLFSALQTVLGVSSATVALPEMSEASLDGRRHVIARRIRRNVLRLFAAGAAAALGTFLLREEIVILLYQRGAFDAAAVERTATVLGILALGVPFLCCVPVLHAGLYAEKRLWRVAGSMLAIAAVDVVLAYGLESRFGLVGVAWAATGATVFAFALLVTQLVRVGIPIGRPESR